MKRVLYFAVALLLSVIALNSCVKDNLYQGKCQIESVNYAPKFVNEGDAVTVTAFITYIGGGISADLVYSAGGAAEVTVPMTGAETGGDFVGVIPAQPYDCPVEFRVVAKNKDGYTSETKGKYTVGDVPQDYTKLRLNELNGNDKFIEIYNAGDQKIKLQGVYIQKDEGLNWTGDNRVLDPGAYLLLYSEDVIATDHPDWDKGLIFNSGLSAKKNVRIQLFDPSGNSIDDFNILKHPGSKVSGSYGRNSDGKWYIQSATPGAANTNGTESVESWF